MADGTIEAGQFLGEDGVFQENWRDHFSEEDVELKTDPTLDTVKDVRSMARSLVATKKMVGADKVALLNEFSTDEEKNEHYSKLGRPDSAEGYELSKVEVPDGVPKDDKFIAKMGQALFEGGASKQLAQTLTKAYMEYTAELTKTMDTEDKLTNTEANKQLHGLWGSGYDTKMKSVNLAIQALAVPIDADFAETLRKETPYDPLAAQLLSKIGEMISEDKGLKGTPSIEGFTPADARAKANEVMSNPYYISEQPTGKPRNAALHKQLVEEVTRLLQVANA